MPKKVDCPVTGFEEVSITLPDRWLVRHSEQFWQAYSKAGEVSVATAQLFGCIALLEQIDGLDGEPLDWPLEVFGWIRETVYLPFEKALYPPKN